MPFEGEYRLRAADGAMRWHLARAVPTWDADGRVGRWFGTFTDIHARRSLEASLRAGDRQFLAIFEGSLDAIVIADDEGRYTAANPAAGRLFGLGPGELVGRRIAEFCAPGYDFAAGWDEFRAADALTGVFRLRRADGTARDVEFAATPDVYPGHHLSILRDVTDRLRAGEALRRSEAAYRLLAENATDIIARHDPEGRFLYISPACRALLGFEPAELIGRGIEEFVHPDDRPRVETLRAEALADAAPRRAEYRARRRDGGYTWLESASRLAPPESPGAAPELVCVARDVTARRAAEEALREAGRLSRSVLDSLSEIVAVLDERGTILTVNESWRQFARENGADETRVCDGANYLGACDAATGEVAPLAGAFAAGLRDVIAGRRGEFALEYPCHAPGRRRWFLGKVTPFRGEGPPRVVVAHEDITPRKVAEETLRQGEALLRGFYNAAPMIMGIVELRDGDLGFLSINETGARFFGSTPEAMQGRLVGELDPFWNATYRAVWSENLRASSAAAAPVRFEYERSTARGPRWLSATASPLPAPPGGPPRFAYIVEDTTERRRVEQALRRSEETFRIVLENSRDVIYQFDLATGRYDYISPAAATVLGRPAEALLAEGLPFYLASIHPEDLARPEAQACRVLTGQFEDLGEPVVEYRFDVPGRGWRWMNDSRMIVNAPGGGRTIVGHVRDVTEQKEAEARQQEYAVRLRALSRQLMRAQEEERRRIARELHDEIGQALTAAKIAVESAARDPSAAAARGRLEDGIALLEQTLGQMRDISLALRPSMLDDLGLVAALRSLVQGMARRTGLEAEFRADDPGRCGPDVEIACYRVAQEALTNVVRHARARHLRVELGRRGPDLALVVADDGAGFGVADATARAVAGASLGVLGMRERVSLLGGSFSLESAPGRGTEVRATFPLDGAAEAPG